MDDSSKAIPSSAPPPQYDRRRFLKRMAWVLLLFMAVYGGLYAANAALPYVGEGASVVYNTKVEHVRRAKIFEKAGDRRKLVIFGNSKMLSGFVPELWDELSGGEFYSYNLGLPNASKFIPVLEAMVASGNIPTEVFITIPWERSKDHNPLVFVENDKEIINQIVPFRNFFRDLAIFANRSRHKGGMKKLYGETEMYARKVIEDRGYHFIIGQSIHPNHELPDDKTLPADQPGRWTLRGAPEKTNPVDGSPNEHYQRLSNLLARHKIKAYFVPSYFRTTEWKPKPGRDPELVERFKDDPNIGVIGPDYFSLPNRLFSDFVHVNEKGAREYTRMLWEESKATLRRDRAP